MLELLSHAFIGTLKYKEAPRCLGEPLDRELR